MLIIIILDIPSCSRVLPLDFVLFLNLNFFVYLWSSFPTCLVSPDFHSELCASRTFGGIHYSARQTSIYPSGPFGFSLWFGSTNRRMSRVHLRLCMGEVKMTTNNPEYISNRTSSKIPYVFLGTRVNTCFQWCCLSELPIARLRNIYIQAAFLETLSEKVRSRPQTSSYWQCHIWSSWSARLEKGCYNNCRRWFVS